MKKVLLSFLAACLIITTTYPQVVETVKWSFSTRQIDEEHVDLIFSADIKSPWHLYGLNIEEGGPIPTSIIFSDTAGFIPVGTTKQSPDPEIVDDQIFDMQLELHNNKATFTQRIKLIQPGDIVVKGMIEYMTCSDIQCVLGDTDFEFRLKGPAKQQTIQPSMQQVAEVINPDTMITTDSLTISESSAKDGELQKQTEPAKKSLWGVFFLAMLAGLGGLLTPCVYPMIPMTVSFFLRGNKSRTKAISEALVFGLSIMFLYTLIGVLVAVFKNPNAVNDFTTNWITNLVFTIIFIILAASFFGMFEIILPSGLANKVDQKADKGGYIGAFFMALAMAILSFSCTGPIVASLLIKASQGEVLEPIIGMAGFSLVFALPFTLFAIFPSWLQNLPKSGNWLNAVKVFFAFILLAFSIYFLGKIDQAYHLDIISRNVFLSIWIVIAILLGFYLLGKIKFAHDGDQTYIGFPRFILAVASFSFAVYLFTGFLGNELKPLSSLMPPSENKTVSTVVNQSSVSNILPDQLCGEPRYADFLTLPHNLHGYYDYEEALACAREKGKPVLVDFVGHTCANCKKMYSEVWSDPRVLELLTNEFIIVALYTDDKTRLPEDEQYTSTIDGKVKSTIGKMNQDIQIARFNSNALPLYAIVDGNGNDLTDTYYTYNPDIEKFINWLKEGLNQ